LFHSDFTKQIIDFIESLKKNKRKIERKETNKDNCKEKSSGESIKDIIEGKKE